MFLIEFLCILLTSAYLAYPHITQAAETDAFTTRYQKIPNAIPMINQEVNRRIDHALVELNRTQAPCQSSELDSALSRELRRPFRGLIEEFIETSNQVPHQKVLLENSIYQNMPLLFNLALTVGSWMGIGLTSHIQHDGLLIGADKFGHFFDEGYYYYYIVHRQGFLLEKALRFGELIESTFEGSGSSGIYSYADLAANYSGYHFWQDTLGSSPENLQSKYVSCSGDRKGYWTSKAPVDLKSYLGPAWDEGMNCNGFQYLSITQGMEKSILALEAKNPHRYHCPIFPERVPAMIGEYTGSKEYSKEYKDVLKRVIQPRLLDSSLR